jgi:hypothetical protein
MMQRTPPWRLAAYALAAGSLFALPASAITSSRSRA